MGSSSEEEGGDLLRAVETLGQRLVAALTPAETWTDLLADFGGALGADRAWFQEVDDPRVYTALGCHGSGRLPALSKQATASERWDFQPHLGPLAQGRTTGMPERLRTALGFQPERIYALVPMPGIGCLAIERSIGREGPNRVPWTPSQLDAVRTAARMLGAALLRQRAEQTLQDREERYRLLLDAVSDPIASLGDDDRFSYVNRAFSQILGHRLAELRSRRLRDLAPAEDHERLHQALTEARDDRGDPQASTFPLRLLTHRGEAIEFWCRIEAPPVRDNATRILAIFHDRRADQAQTRVRRQFASLVHHELKTPLTSVVGAARLLPAALDRDPADMDRLLEVLTRNSSRLSKLIEDLLEFHSLTLGEIRLEPQPFDLAADLTAMAKTWNDDRPTEAVPFEVRIEPGLTVFADPESVRRIVSELLINAPQLGWSDRVRIEARPRGRWLWIHLLAIDQGLEEGPAPSPPVVLPADRIDTMGHGESHGIGLNLIQALAETLGGELRFDHTADGPTRVLLVLPRPSDSDTPTSGAPTNRPHPDPGTTSRVDPIRSIHPTPETRP